MKNLFNTLKTVILMIISVISFFLGATAFSPSMFINLLLLIFAIIILMVACDIFDKNNHLGNYSDDNS